MEISLADFHAIALCVCKRAGCDSEYRGFHNLLVYTVMFLSKNILLVRVKREGSPESCHKNAMVSCYVN